MANHLHYTVSTQADLELLVKTLLAKLPATVPRTEANVAWRVAFFLRAKSWVLTEEPKHRKNEHTWEALAQVLQWKHSTLYLMVFCKR